MNSSDANNTSNPFVTTKRKPDEATLRRFSNLAPIGDMLFEISNDNSEDTYFEAKASLDRFKEGVLELDLPPKIMNGTMNLINYLSTKIEKRKRQAGGEFSAD